MLIQDAFINKFHQMDVTLLYNGYNLQRRKMYTLSPRHNLISQVDIVWPDSLRHDDLSPLSRLKRRQSLEGKQAGELHNSFVDSYLSRQLNLSDSRTNKIKHVQKRQQGQSLNKTSAAYKDEEPEGREGRQSVDLKLPKIFGEEGMNRKSLVSQIIGDRPRSYFSTLLSNRLQKYSRPGQK